MWQEYRATWKEFSRRLNELQRMVEAGETAQVEEARIRVEQARMAHNEARDRLAEQLTLPRDEQRVRNTARLIWEFAGKPQGTAEKDWLRAERTVRSASA